MPRIVDHHTWASQLLRSLRSSGVTIPATQRDRFLEVAADLIRTADAAGRKQAVASWEKGREPDIKLIKETIQLLLPAYQNFMANHACEDCRAKFRSLPTNGPPQPVGRRAGG